MTWPYAPSIARGFLLGVVFITHIYTHLKKKLKLLLETTIFMLKMVKNHDFNSQF